MRSMHLLLNEAEYSWRDDIIRDFPLRSNTPLIRKTSQNGRDWAFKTDLTRIFAEISGDESLQKKFDTLVTKYWDGDSEELARETLRYLLFHELYHPIEAPFSVEGDDSDKKKITQAIRKGVLQAEPRLSSLEQMVKVQSAHNLITDFILDNRFFLDNLGAGYVRDDIIPVFDFLEMQDSQPRTDHYTVTRIMYGAMYGPKASHEYFAEKAGNDGIDVAEKALAALIRKPVQLPIPKNSPAYDDANISQGNRSAQDASARLQDYAADIRKVFCGKDRYNGIKRLMAVLGPYIQTGMPQGRSDLQGEGSGSSPLEILQDLMDGMTEQQQIDFVKGLGEEDQSALEQAAAQMQSSQEDTKPGSSDPYKDQMRNLDVLAAHEFYKRNHPKVSIIGGKKTGESLVVGKRNYWDLKQSRVLTQDELARVNLRMIDALQKKTRLPWLIDLGNSTYRLNEYELKERNIKDIVYSDAHIDVPDVVEFYIDGSSSMFNHNRADFKVNDGSRWDMLSHVMYGFVDALLQGGKQVGKRTKIRLHNFADSQIDSELIPADSFWRGDPSALKVMFKPENGNYTYPCVKESSNRGKTAYVLITDGDIHNCDSEAPKIREISKGNNNQVVLFEIGGTYELGRELMHEPNIIYHQVHDKVKMLEAGLEVLLSK